jgi:CRISPR-associated protein Cas2
MTLFLISYDISPDKRRNALAKLLEGHGSRVQYSVFECDLTPTQWVQLRGRLERILRPAEGDSVRIYRLCAACRQSIEILGTGAVETTPDVYII